MPTLLALGLIACAPTYAPPLQSPHGGAPGRTTDGDVVVGGGAAGPVGGVPSYGGPAISYGIRDWVAVEGGADLARKQWAMGWGGARFTLDRKRHHKFHFASDLESAVGVGWGGELCGNNSDGGCDDTDSLTARDRYAGGGLLGVGAAGHFSFFSVFARSRAQLTGASGVPATLWGTLGGGFQFRIAHRLDLYTQAGLAGYTNSIDRMIGSVYELGAAVRLPGLLHRR